ncbi:adaptin N-terminal domain-containing protein [Heterostelium album PN500]|uniref:Coatomer subunit gamma n=1 Tax=Heterostelium pallidum (strain ATCC 26659 / Pp 5 / PN500) TaxID=670386 RepID=D3BBR7_HETP5|nr:adaptin N-terminal domain-containing protein [Heterostelium album PN500]EFA81100.1 adaptin N-terminal domain-containing protein [Heterostelium album PN500]|eukprot:XP_020433218.1 adaptin N-terminal domain-containing protein [Heterostelium album PN500]
MGRFEKKDDDEYEYPFEHLDKGQVVQEKRVFNDTQIHPRKCSFVISEFLYLLARGDTFTKTEATDVFFAATKLFQSKDIPLRRMTYLLLKEFSTISQDAIIVTSSLIKDMSHKIELYRANSIRILCKIIDASSLPQLERHFKQSIVEKDPHVSSAALVSSIHLLRVAPDTVKRWANEVQEAISNKSNMVQYHALALLHRIKQHDRLAVTKLVSSLIRGSLRSPYAQCYLIRCAVEVIEETNTEDRTFYDYIESCLRNRNEMVAYEAARSICSLKNASLKELTSAVGILQLFLSSSKPTLRFAAVRTLNKLAQTNPLAVVPCNLDMENLISDSNRSIATLAITTLLKIGNESNVERLIKQISNFLGDINDEFKIVVVESITMLSVKFPKKFKHLIIFLNKILRDEGSLQLKQTTLDAILNVVNHIPESKEIALNELCDFIEDCEYPDLSVQILHLLGQEGPLTSSPSKYIRYIYNRISLDSGTIRAAAVTSIAKFGLLYEPMRQKVVILIQRCLLDEDDEVRDRATLYLRLFKEDNIKLLGRILLDDVHVPMLNLQRSLETYLESPAAEPFDISKVSTVIEAHSPVLGDKGSSKPSSTANTPKAMSLAGSDKPAAATGQSAQEAYAAQLAAISNFATYGKLLKSSELVELTETETEYVVSCVKHVFQEHLVFQFNVTNTLNDQLLENVYVKMVPSNSKLVKYEFHLLIESLPYGEPHSCYVSVRIPPGAYPTLSFTNMLKFKVREVDPSTGEPDEGGFDEQYNIEDLEVVPKDYMLRAVCPNFQEEWKRLPEDIQSIQTFGLVSIKNIDDAIKEIIKTLSMAPCEKSEVAQPKANKHILYLSGRFVNGTAVLTRARMKIDGSGQSVDVELTVKSEDEIINEFVSSAFA